MDTAFTPVIWEEAVKGYLLHLRATRALNTAYFYDVQLRMLVRWADENQVPLEGFGKRNLDA